MPWVKALMHVHSDWSYDGHYTLDQLRVLFARRGLRVLLMTEHDRNFDEARWRDYRRACAEASSEDFLIVPGIEYSDPDNRIHLLTWGSDQFLGAERPLDELLGKVRGTDMFQVWAHPEHREAWRLLDEAWLEQLGGIEVWNRKSDGIRPSRTARDLLRKAPRARGFVGMDFHTRRNSWPLYMKLRIPGAVTEEAVLASLRQGPARPTFAGMPVSWFLGFPGYHLMSLADVLRRGLLRCVRRLR